MMPLLTSVRVEYIGGPLDGKHEVLTSWEQWPGGVMRTWWEGFGSSILGGAGHEHAMYANETRYEAPQRTGRDQQELNWLGDE